MPLPDVLKILEVWGVQGRSAGKEFYALCPLHDDNSPSMSINTHTGAWVCYTGCGSGRDIFSLGARIFNTNSYQMQSELDRYQFIPTTDGLLEDLNAKAEEFKVPPKYDNDFANTVGGIPRWFADRNFDSVSIADFGIRGNPKDNSIQFPIYFKGEYLGFIKRLSPAQAEVLHYRYHYTTGFDKSKILFGWDTLVNRTSTVLPLRKLVLTEGPLDTIWMQRWGQPAVSILGAYLSQEQLKVLRLNGIEEVCLALDDDIEGIIALNKIAPLLTPYFKVYTLKYPDKPLDKKKQDPQDMTPQFLIHPTYISWSEI